MNQKFLLTWTDEDGNEHEDYFPSREEAEDHVDYLEEEFVVESYKIEAFKE